MASAARGDPLGDLSLRPREGSCSLGTWNPMPDMLVSEASASLAVCGLEAAGAAGAGGDSSL